jgi:hypothetical protein
MQLLHKVHSLLQRFVGVVNVFVENVSAKEDCDDAFKNIILQDTQPTSSFRAVSGTSGGHLARVIYRNYTCFVSVN